MAGCPPFYLLSFWSLLKYNIIKYSKSLHSVIHFMVRIFYSQPCFQSNIRDHKWSTTSPDRQGSFFRTFQLIAYITIWFVTDLASLWKRYNMIERTCCKFLWYKADMLMHSEEGKWKWKKILSQVLFLQQCVGIVKKRIISVVGIYEELRIYFRNFFYRNSKHEIRKYVF